MTAAVPFGAISIFRAVQAADAALRALRGSRPRPSAADLEDIGLGERPARRGPDGVALAIAHRG